MGKGRDLRKKYRAKPAVMLPPSVDMCSSISLAPLCRACRHRLRVVQADVALIGPMKWTTCKLMRAFSSSRCKHSKFCDTGLFSCPEAGTHRRKDMRL